MNKNLGKRNALINFKLNSKSVLRLTQPTMKELWQLVVEDEKQIDFPYINDRDKDKVIEELLPDFLQMFPDDVSNVPID